RSTGSDVDLKLVDQVCGRPGEVDLEVAVDLGGRRASPAPPVAEPRRPAEPRRQTEPRYPLSRTALHCPTASAATTATAPTAAIASPTVLTFDAEGRTVDFDMWVDNLKLFLQCDSRDGVSVFDHTSGVSTAPAATADIARYSSPATTALNRLMLPYLFPDLAAFTTVADLVAHLRNTDACYRAALPTEFCAKNPPPMYIALYYLVTCLPDSLASVRNHFLSLCPTELTIDLLEELLAATKKIILALLLLLLSTSLALRRSELRLSLVEDAATARARGERVMEGMAGAAAEAVEEAQGVAVEVGVVPGVGASMAVVEVVEAAAEVAEAAAPVVEAAAAVAEVAVAVVLVEVQPRSVEALVVASASSSRVPVRPHRPSSFVSGTLGVGGQEVLVPALTFFAPAVVVGRRAGCRTLQNVAIFDLDFDAILAAMYALTDSAEGDCYLSVPPDPGIETAAIGASECATPGTSESVAPGAGESALSSTATTEALHTFTLDSGASCSFFRDSTTLTPLCRPVEVYLADPSGGPVLAHSSTVLPCLAAPSGLLSGLHLPSFSTNLVSGANLLDAWVNQFTPGGQRVTHCTCSRTGRHLAKFTRRPGSSLYSLTTAPPLVSASSQVAASSQVFAAASRSSPVSAPCSCRPRTHETLLWHHCLGHPYLPRRQGMASRTLVSGLPRCLPPLHPGPAPTCVPCVEGLQRADPHSSLFPPTEAPLQTLHMDVWGPARVRGQGHERYFLLVIDDYSHRGGEFSSDLLRAFCRAEGICQTFTLPASPQQNGIAEGRIGMVMDVARTSMIHAAAPHFLWPFAVQYAAHQINLQPCVSLPETTPTLRWTGKVGDASAFRFYQPTSRLVLSSQDVTFDESVSYYHLFPYRAASLPTLPLFLAPGTPPVDLLPPQGPATSDVSQVDPAEPVEVAVYSGAVTGAEPMGARPGCVDSWGAELERVEPWGAEPKLPLSPQRLHEWYARRCRRATGTSSTGAAGGATGVGAAGGAAGAGAAGGAAGAGAAGGTAGAGAAGGAAGAGAAGPGGARTGCSGAAGTGGTAGVGAAGTEAGGAVGVLAGDPGAEGTGAVSANSGGAAWPRPYYVPLLQQVLGLPPSPGPTPPLQSLQPVQSQSQLQPSSPLPGPSPYSGPTRGLTERRETESRLVSPVSRAASPVRTAPQRVPLPSPPASSLPEGLDPESDSLRAASPTITRFLATAVTYPLFESSAASALVTELLDFAAACRLDYATSLLAESASASVCSPSIRGECALGTDVLEDRQEEIECFAAAVLYLVSMLLAPEGDPDAPDIPTPRSYAEAIEGPYSSQWQAAMDVEIASWKSTGTYVDEVPPPGANIISGMWIFRVKQPPGSPPVFKARYVARCFSQRQGVDFFQNFSPTPKMTTLRVLLHVAGQRDYELHSLDFSTTFLQGSLHEEIWLRRPPGFTESFPAGTQWSLRRPVYGLRQAPREWHDTLRTTLATLGFAPSTADLSLFLCTDTTLSPFYVLVYVDDLVFATADTEALAHVKAQCTITLTQSHMVQKVLQRFEFRYSSPQSTPLPACHSLSAPPSDESVEPSGPYPALVGCLITSGMGLVLGGRARVVLIGHIDASWVDDLATQRSSQGYTFSLGSGSFSWQSTRSSSVLSSSCEAEIYAGAMAAQELRWLTYLLTDLGEAPRSPPVLYVDNMAMLALCQEHRLEHTTKHISLRYFLARELQQRGQLRLAYVASQANTTDVLTNALQPCDHQRFCTVLGLVPTMPHLLTS
ncbi:unnamed protein product, partial [Closterium sp. NIES-53]